MQALPRSIRAATLKTAGYGLAIAVAGGETHHLTVTATARLRTTRRSPVRTVLLVRRRTSFTGRAGLTLRLPRSLRPAVRAGTRIDVRLAVTDDAGNRWTRTVRVRVR